MLVVFALSFVLNPLNFVPTSGAKAEVRLQCRPEAHRAGVAVHSKLAFPSDGFPDQTRPFAFVFEQLQHHSFGFLGASCQQGQERLMFDIQLFEPVQDRCLCGYPGPEGKLDYDMGVGFGHQ
jgi:hypothetical protein